jgi:hypothetical protein
VTILVQVIDQCVSIQKTLIGKAVTPYKAFSPIGARDIAGAKLVTIYGGVPPKEMKRTVLATLSIVTLSGLRLVLTTK